MDKAPDAFRTISEVADDLDVPQHVLRFWETRFAQIRPMKRSGGRRYYRPDDVDLLKGIRQLLYGEGYTIRGVQRILKEQGVKSVQALSTGAKLAPGRGDTHRKAAALTGPGGDDPSDIEDVDDEIEADEDDAREAASDDGDAPDERIEPVIRMEPQLGTRPAAEAIEPYAQDRHPQHPHRHRQDMQRLKAVLTDLRACRQMLDEVLNGTEPASP